MKGTAVENMTVWLCNWF